MCWRLARSPPFAHPPFFAAIVCKRTYPFVAPAALFPPSHRLSQTRSALPDVRQSEDEDEVQSDAPPARKKSRPSVETGVNSDEEEEETVVSKRRGKKAKTVEDEGEDGDEDEEEAPASLPKRRTSGRQPER